MNTALCGELDSNPQTTSSWFSMNAKYVDFQFQIPENWIKVCLFLSYCNGFNYQYLQFKINPNLFSSTKLNNGVEEKSFWKQSSLKKLYHKNEVSKLFHKNIFKTHQHGNKSILTLLKGHRYLPSFTQVVPSVQAWWYHASGQLNKSWNLTSH